MGILRELYQFLLSVKKKNVIIIKTFSYVYKIAWGPGRIRLNHEFQARLVLSNLFRDVAHCYEPFLCGNSYLVGRSRRLDEGINDSVSDNYVAGLVSKLPETSSFLNWTETFERDALEIVFNTLSGTSRYFVEGLLTEVKLPVTGAHGDFSIHNFLGTPTKIMLIDWEYYRGNGSFVTDVLRYFMIKRSAFNGVSFLSPESLIVNDLPSYLVDFLFKNCGVTCREQIKILGAVGNCTAHWDSQHGENLAKELDKYLLDFQINFWPRNHGSH